LGGLWLNPPGRLVLAKEILLALLVFQYSSLLAPMSVKRKIARQIRKFLWEGRKNSTIFFLSCKLEDCKGA
jgi:hypothetical protein